MDSQQLFLTIRIIIVVICTILIIIYLRKFIKSKYFPILIRKIDGTLTEIEGEKVWSLTRVQSLSTFLISNISFWGLFIAGSIIAGKLLEIPETLGIVYLSINGIQGVVKVLQKKYEA